VASAAASTDPVTLPRFTEAGGAGEEDAGGGAALLPGSQAALLTAGADGALRVWVEVTLAPALGTDGAPPGWRPGSAGGEAGAAGAPRSPAGSPRDDALAARVSRFCVTLVVPPPAGTWAAPGGGGGVRACWAVPAGPGPTTGAQLRAARVLWIVGVGPAGAPPGRAAHPASAGPRRPTGRIFWASPLSTGASVLASGREGRRPPRMRAALMRPRTAGGREAQARAGVRPCRCRAPSSSAPRRGAGGSAGEGAAERLLLWAVDGLAGVVLSGRPGTLGGGGARTPRAVLWGQHAGALAWPPALAPGAVRLAGLRA